MLIILGFVLFFVVGTIGLTLLAARGGSQSSQRLVRRVGGFVDAQLKRTASAVNALAREDESPVALASTDPRTEAYLLFGLGLLGAAALFVLGVVLLTV
ncbi:hypothetical protein [Nocardioides sp.]|uniref:hypothetical protein n=1 Tax=Nocardioides sp. TaxID=35761 RepID=UPI003566682B